MRVFCLAATSFSLLLGSVAAQDEPVEHTEFLNTEEIEATDSEIVEDEEIPETLAASPEDLVTEVTQSKRRKEAHVDFEILEPLRRHWRCFSERVESVFGLKLSWTYTSLYQRASQAMYQKEGAGGDVDFIGHWPLFGGEDCCQAGYLGFRAESRHPYTPRPPSDLGDSIGSLWRTTRGFTSQQFALVELWWEHHLIKDKAGGRFGKINLKDYFNTYRYGSANTGFLTQALSDDPARAVPQAGLGMVVGGRQMDGLYFALGWGDANAIKTNGPHSFFDDYEFFTAAEFGWRPDIPCWGKGKYYISFWHTDHVSRIPDSASGYGLSLLALQQIRRYVPFFRYSRSNSATTEVRQLLIAGLGVEGPLCYADDLFAFACAWGEPMDSSLRDQTVLEAFYRLQFNQSTQLTPDIQLILHPSENPAKGSILVFSFRIRVLM